MNKFGKVAAIAGVAAWCVNAGNVLIEGQAAAEERSREAFAAGVAQQYLSDDAGRIVVQEGAHLSDGTIDATLLKLGGSDSLYESCEISYRKHPDDHSILAVGSLILGDCVE